MKNFNPIYTSFPNIRFSLRLTEKLYNEIAQCSQECNISMNTLILKCIEYALENRKRLSEIKGRFYLELLKYYTSYKILLQ